MYIYIIHLAKVFLSCNFSPVFPLFHTKGDVLRMLILLFFIQRKQTVTKWFMISISFCGLQKNSVGFGTTWMWVNDDRSLIHGRTIPVSVDSFSEEKEVRKFLKLGQKQNTQVPYRYSRYNCARATWMKPIRSCRTAVLPLWPVTICTNGCSAWVAIALLSEWWPNKVQ